MTQQLLVNVLKHDEAFQVEQQTYNKFTTLYNNLK